MLLRSFAATLLLITAIRCRGPLLVEPSFLLVEEDWDVGEALPVTVCPGAVRILSGDPGKFFSIVKLNSSCSSLKLNKQLDADKEGGQSFSLVLAGRRQAQASLDIQVVDVNDNAPVFLGAPSVLSLKEDTPTGTVVTKIRVADPDTGVGGLVRFTVDNDEYFNVDKQKCADGECWTTLRLRKELDFEKQRTHEITVTAEDGEPQKRSNSANHTISIQLIDVQDEPPVWKSALKAEATSVGQKILKLEAIDGDEGSKNEIRYSMGEESEYLTVDEGTGWVTVIKMPSESGERTFTVKATEQDSVGQASAAVLTITFHASPVSSPKTSLCNPVKGTLKKGASSFESPLKVLLNLPVSTAVIEGSRGFTATLEDDSTVVITVSQPELIKNDMTLNLATDQGSCVVEVQVVDGQAPVFDHDSFLFYVVENHRPGVLGFVKTSSSKVKYSILESAGSKFFSISERGELRSLQPIDREQYDRFDLVVRATDEATGKWTDCPGKVVVKDVNDNSPKFEKEVYEVTVDEERSMKQRITAIDTDLGENGTIVYGLEEAPEGVPIDFSSGILFIGKLDRDTMDSDNLTVVVRATDKGQPPRSSTAQVVITVRDINDNYPLFTNSHYSLVLDANISPGGVVGAVSAEDADATAPNNYIRYTSDDPRFRVTDGGEIIYTGGNDEAAILSKETSAEFSVTATDGGQPPRNSTSRVAINEHKKALQSELTTELNETGEKQKIHWANARMPGYKYELVKASARGFRDEEVRKWVEVDENTGEIHTKKSITPEVVKRIRLSISMRKGKREVPVELIINIVDGETAPSFRKDNYRAVLPEDTPNGSRVLQVKAHPDDSYKPVFKNGSVFTATVREDSQIGTVLDLPYPLATDEDEGDNSRLEFDLLGGDGGIFAIDKKNSTITLRKRLDYEVQRTHSLPIRCSDGVHEVFAAITVQVEDTNDNNPQLLNVDLNQLSVAEDADIGAAVTSLAATDADEGGAQKVTLSANHTLFRVDDGGKLVVASALKGYAGERVCGTITARDSGEPPLETTAPFCVTVYPATYNTHSPLIVSPKQNSIHYFDENIQLDELLRIKVLDEGVKDNITFSLDTEFKRDWELFRVNASGALLARTPFDFEKKAVHEVKVKACRATNCSSVHLFISVNDRNDNCPIFPRGDVLLSATENDRSPTPRMIGRFPPALDADFHADNTKVCYSTDSPLFFFTDSSLPVLYTNTTFDREQLSEHRIMITAYDCLLSCRDPFKPVNASLVAVVKILDVNDNFPKFSQKIYQTTVIQGQTSPGSHLTTLGASDPDEEKDGLRFSIKGAVRAGKQTYPSGSNGPLSLDHSTGEVIANEALRESSYSFTAAVIDGAGHEDTAMVTISVVTYAQQAELLFDAPFDFIVRNEKHIVSLLTEATQLKAIVDRCRQNANFTLVLAHFMDAEDVFVDVENAVARLTNSNSSARRELRSAYGLRDPVVPVAGVSQEKTLQAIAGAAVVAAGTALLIVICMCCRRRNKYDGKLRSISQQAVLHQATLGRPPPKVMNPSLFCVDGVRMAAPPPPPLQSTEL